MKPISRHNFTRGIALGLAAAAATVAISIAPAGAAERASHADTARYLAGLELPDSSPVSRLTKRRSWQAHAKSFDRAWTSIDKRQLSKIRTWTKEHLPNPQKTVLYMFSGPDFLYANAFFPDASTYVLSALEPVGVEPDIMNMSPGALSTGLVRLRSSLNNVLRLSFFITKDMRSKLKGGGFRGTLPVLYVFLARAGKVVEDLSYVNLTPEGELETLTGKDARRATGVKITFSGENQEGLRTLYYFKTNISDYGIKKSGFLEFCAKLGPADSFIKSASYLPHKSHFSKVRNLLLNQSERIVQDDTGIPLKFFNRDTWKLEPFGRYVRPISIFSGRYQSGMAKLFRSKARKPINFGLGYHIGAGRTSVLVASRKTPKVNATD